MAKQHVLAYFYIMRYKPLARFKFWISFMSAGGGNLIEEGARKQCLCAPQYMKPAQLTASKLSWSTWTTVE